MAVAAAGKRLGVNEDFVRIGRDGAREDITRALAIEAPVAVEIGGLGYAVLMATPEGLEELGYGFLRAERLVYTVEDVVSIEVHDGPVGTILRITLGKDATERARGRVRHRTTESACGLCGVENLEQALRPLPPVKTRSAADDAALFRAIDTLADHQPLNRATRAVHAAALCGADGTIRLVREDVGRHNAFDKLIGAMMRGGLDWDGGFALLSSRCSFELIEKAVLAGCPMLATVSAPTTLAVTRARDAGLALRVVARSDAVLAAG